MLFGINTNNQGSEELQGNKPRSSIVQICIASILTSQKSIGHLKTSKMQGNSVVQHYQIVSYFTAISNILTHYLSQSPETYNQF